MTDNEKWVAFYYFWKLQYEARWFMLYNIKKINTKIDDLVQINEVLSCPELKDYLDRWSPLDPMIYKKIELPVFPCNKKETKCSKCPKVSQIIKKVDLIKKYSDIEYSLKKYLYTTRQLIVDSTKFLYNLANIKTQDSTGDKLLNVYVYSTPVARLYIDAGIKLLGIEKLQLTEENTLSGKVIAEIDLSYPTSFLNMRLETLKNLKFETTPKFDKLYSQFKVENITDFKKEKDIIKEKPDLGFNINYFESRAIGLWLFDVIASNKFENSSQAVKALKDGTWLGTEQNNFISLHQERNILEILGKDASEFRVLDRLFTSTEKCVEQHEVLKMH